MQLPLELPYAFLHYISKGLYALCTKTRYLTSKIFETLQQHLHPCRFYITAVTAVETSLCTYASLLFLELFDLSTDMC